MKRKYEKGTDMTRREPPVFEFEGEVTLVRLALTSSVETIGSQMAYLSRNFHEHIIVREWWCVIAFLDLQSGLETFLISRPD